MKEYKRLHIIKHALESYIERPEVSEKDLAQEKTVLKEITEDIGRLKEQYGIDKN